MAKASVVKQPDGTFTVVVPNSHRKEPALTVGTIISTLVGIFTLVNNVFPNLISPDAAYILYVIMAISYPLVTALMTREYVWSPASVKQILDEAIQKASEVKKN